SGRRGGPSRWTVPRCRRWASACASARPEGGTRLAPRDDPHGVNDARNVAEQRQQAVEPEMQAEADLEEDAERRQQDGQDDADDVQTIPPGLKSALYQCRGRPPVPLRRTPRERAALPSVGNL